MTLEEIGLILDGIVLKNESRKVVGVSVCHGYRHLKLLPGWSQEISHKELQIPTSHTLTVSVVVMDDNITEGFESATRHDDHTAAMELGATMDDILKAREATPDVQFTI